MIFAIPLAWLQLVREKARLVIALAGIAFAVILMMLQLGFQDALFESSVTLHRRLKTDIVLINPQSTALIAMKSFARSRLYQAQGIAGVESVIPIYLDFGFWKNPETRETRQILALAFDPDVSVLDLPEVEALQNKVKVPDVVLFDQASREEFGPIAAEFRQGKRVTTEVSSREVRVGGLFTLGASFAADGNLITSDLNFLRIFDQRPPGLIDVGLIRTQPEADIESVIQRLQTTLPDDVIVLSKEGFTEFEQAYWRSSTAIGFIFTLGTMMGFIVGIVIVYQILYTDVSNHLPEYATLKAMGYKSTFLFSVVIQEALILSVLGYLPGFGLSWLLYGLTRSATALPLTMVTSRALLVFTLTLVMCLLSGAIAMRKVQAADPADIF
ncbi:ABC transporter permease DevC [Acaryochloris thomasi]|nr:ABC transporter permease DevC [Acaryochloris thomasi]